MQCTTVVYNPMVPLNPETNEAVQSTMVFVMNQAHKAGMCCATLTFDQPLYLRAYRLKADDPQSFSKLFLRLGGFHLLVSYLGAGCKLMEDSGLEDLWETVYARKSIPKMMEGKAYSKTLRACLLTDAALHLVLLPSEMAPLTSDSSVQSQATESSQQLTQEVWPALEKLYIEVTSGETPLDNVSKCPELCKLHKQVEDVKKKTRKN